MRAKHTALILTAGFLLLPALSWSQFPGQGGSGGGRSGFQMDPDQLFNFASKGKDVIVVSELDAISKMMFDRMSSKLGLTGNEISREQFKGAMTRVTEMAKSGELSGMNLRPAEGGAGGFSMPGGMTMIRPGGETSDRDRRRDEYFKRLDRNEDGLLEFDELSGDPIAEGLQTERAKYDVNSDGFIDPTEFRTYLIARLPAPESGADTPGVPGAPKDGDERKRPTIIRAGNLPRDFPYAALDTDLDGQIGLYEWKNGGKRIAEFLPLDLNNDGFMTVEEFYRKKKEDSVAAAGSQAGDFARGGRLGGNGGDPRMLAAGPGGALPGGNRGFGGGDRGMTQGGNSFGGGDRSRGPGGAPGSTPGGERERGPGGPGGNMTVPGGGFGGNAGTGGSGRFGGMTIPGISDLLGGRGLGGGSGRFGGMTIPGMGAAPGAGPGAGPAAPGGERGPGRGNRGSGGGESGGETPRPKGKGR